MTTFQWFLNEPPRKVAVFFLEQHGVTQAALQAKAIALIMLEGDLVRGYHFMKDVIAAIEDMEN